MPNSFGLVAILQDWIVLSNLDRALDRQIIIFRRSQPLHILKLVRQNPIKAEQGVRLQSVKIHLHVHFKAIGHIPLPFNNSHFFIDYHLKIHVIAIFVLG